MANEFVARKGLIARASSQITGSLNVTGDITASNITASFIGDGSGLYNLPTSQTSSISIDTYKFVSDGIIDEYVLSSSYDENSLFVSVDGLSYTSTNDYIISASTVQLTSVAPSESVILIRGFVVSSDANGTFTGSFIGDGSGLTGIVSSSYAVTASYAENAGGDTGTTTTVLSPFLLMGA